MSVTVEAARTKVRVRRIVEFEAERRLYAGWRKAGTRVFPKPIVERSIVSEG